MKNFIHRLAQIFENDTGRISWGRVGSFLCLLALITFTLMIWKYGKHKDMAQFVDFCKETNTKLAVLIPTLYAASKSGDAFGKPASLTDNIPPAKDE